MRAIEPCLSDSVNHASLTHGFLKNAYPRGMREKTRQELKLESYERDQDTIAGRIVVRMEEKGLTASDLAAATGMSFTGVGFILTGDTKYPRPETLVRLSDLLDLEIRWLAVKEGPRERANAQADKHVSAGRGSLRRKPARADGQKAKKRMAG